MKIHSVEAELFRTDRDDKANRRFSEFCERAYQSVETDEKFRC